MQIDINASASLEFTQLLEKMHRSALPNAVRSTLNAAVFDVKTNTMPVSAKGAFVQRQPNFFKANSRFENATGYDINTMKATVGMFPDKLRNAKNNYAVQDLEQQEHGGTVHKKSFIATELARKDKSMKSLVRPNARLSAIEKMIKSKDARGKNEKEQFVKSAYYAGKGGFLLYKNMLFKIDAQPKKIGKKSKTIIKRTPIYSFVKGRSVHIESATHFMSNAALQSGRKMPDFYAVQAQREIDKQKWAGSKK